MATPAKRFLRPSPFGSELAQSRALPRSNAAVLKPKLSLEPFLDLSLQNRSILQWRGGPVRQSLNLVNHVDPPLFD